MAKPVGKPNRWIYLAPILVFLSVSLMLGLGLTLNPREVPSALIGRPVPEFSLPPVQGRTLGLSSADPKGEVSLVNVFASSSEERRLGEGWVRTFKIRVWR